MEISCVVSRRRRIPNRSGGSAAFHGSAACLVLGPAGPITIQTRRKSADGIYGQERQSRKQRTACLVLGVYESRRLTVSAEQFDVAVGGGYLGNLLRRGDLEGKLGQSLLLFNVPEALCERVLLVGCGRERDLDDRRFQQIMTHVATALNDTGATEAVVYLTDLAVRGRDLNWKIRQMVEVVEGSQYRFDLLKSKRTHHAAPCARLYSAYPAGGNWRAANRR